MSKSLSGNLMGIFIVILGCLAGFGAYQISFPTGIVIGVGVALFGATIVNPAVIRLGASDFKDSAEGIVDLLPVKIGRREHDTVVLKPKTEEPLK